MMPKVIAICGFATAGKSTLAKHIVQRHGYFNIPFAGPLKAAVRGLLDYQFVPFSKAERILHGDLKETPIVELAGKTSRFLMQTLGTEWGRQTVDPDFWTILWHERSHRHHAVVVDDLRFQNEAQMVRALGGSIIRIERPGLAGGDISHISELEQLRIEADFVLTNDGTPQDMFLEFDNWLRKRQQEGI
jgi:hypothetical protein